MNLARAQTKLGNTVWHRNWLYKRFYDEQRFQAVEQRRNVLVADGTSTGKTTLVSALLAEVAKTSVSACHIQTATFQSLIGVSVL
jgi:predicted GTPase